MKRFVLVSFILGVLTLTQAANSPVSQVQEPLSPQLTQEDAALFSETYHLWKTHGNKLWMGWSEIQIPMLYITADYEYAIGFPKTMPGFQPFRTAVLPDEKIQVRKRILDPELSASFDIEGIDAVVIGRPTAIGRSSSEWVITAIHEMFHVWQTSKGADQKVAELQLGSVSDASWQLNYPFPYKDADVMRLIHLQSYLIYLAATNTDDESMKYNAGTALEAVDTYRSALKRQDATGHLYDYSKFQEWVEGIAFYTELQMAKAAADVNYQPTEAFRRLPNFKSYQQLWEEKYKNKIFLAKHAGRTARSRTAFYGVGLGKGLLLDRLMPDWKKHYFDGNVWLDDLLARALSEQN